MSSLNYHPAGVATYMTLLSAGEAPSGATTLAGSVSTFQHRPSQDNLEISSNLNGYKKMYEYHYSYFKPIATYIEFQL